MKKSLLILPFFLLIASPLLAQTKIGLRLAPGISYSRAEHDGNNLSVDNNDAALRFTFGPVLDHFFRENYAFSTGLWFSTRRIGFEVTEGARPEQYNLNTQYVQVPLSLKLFTNEVSTDLRVYFQIGANLDIKIQENANEPNDNFATDNLLRPIDTGILLGSGVELVMGANTIMFGGISYNRGLIDVIRDDAPSRINGFLASGQPAEDGQFDVDLNQDFVSIEIGIKF